MRSVVVLPQPEGPSSATTARPYQHAPSSAPSSEAGVRFLNFERHPRAPTRRRAARSDGAAEQHQQAHVAARITWRRRRLVVFRFARISERRFAALGEGVGEEQADPTCRRTARRPWPRRDDAAARRRHRDIPQRAEFRRAERHRRFHLRPLHADQAGGDGAQREGQGDDDMPQDQPRHRFVDAEPRGEDQQREADHHGGDELGREERCLHRFAPRQAGIGQRQRGGETDGGGDGGGDHAELQADEQAIRVGRVVQEGAVPAQREVARREGAEEAAVVEGHQAGDQQRHQQEGDRRQHGDARRQAAGEVQRRADHSRAPGRSRRASADRP